MNEHGIEGKVVAVTGASSGIGRATAREVAARGAKVVVGARRADRLAELVREIEGAGGTASFVDVDVTRRDDVARLVDAAGERYGALDVLVSNAGVAHLARFDEGRVDDWEAMIDVNLRGVLYGIAAALPVFRRQGAGHFVHVVSTAGLRIVPTQGVYAATKNAVRTISEALRQEAGPHLRVTNVSPGYVLTELLRDPVTKTVAAAAAELAIAPEAVARAIAFAIAQPADVDVGDLVIRPTAQG